MAHNIKGTMFYSFVKPAWHALREPFMTPHTAEEALTEIAPAVEVGGEPGFTVTLRAPKLAVLTDGVMEEKELEGQNFIVRGPMFEDPNEAIYPGSVSERFHPLQPIEICRAYDSNVKRPIETMAFLGSKAESMFISWELPEFAVKENDVLKLFGVIKAGWDGMHGASLFSSIYRPVCQNTLNLAEGWAEKNADGHGKGSVWKGKAVNPNLLRDLGYWMEHVQSKAEQEAELLKEFFGMLAKTPISSDLEAQEIILEAFPIIGNNSKYYPEKLRDQKELTTLEENRKLEDMRNGIFTNWAEQDGLNVTSDFYGLLNATTAYVCHDLPSKRPIAESVMFGNRADISMTMVSTLANRLK